MENDLNLLQKTKRIHLNKVCRSCLSERGHLRNIFSTRIPVMMEACASVKVSETDKLPPHICVSCFHQIAKFYTFKKKMEHSDRILRAYINQNKLKEDSKGYQDILDMAVTDAEIDEHTHTEIKEDYKEENATLSEDDMPLSERKERVEKQKKIKSPSKKEAKENNVKIAHNNTLCFNEDREMQSLKTNYNIANDNIGIVFSGGPPPLVPLKPVSKPTLDDANINRILPDNTPPLVPIKPVSTTKPEVIVESLGASTQQFSCAICNEEFSTLDLLRKHIGTSCQTVGLQCNICKKEFKDRKRLIGHLKGHITPKNYRCKICGKCYPSPSTWKVHMRTHTGERPFKCQICGKGFVRWAGVIGHMKTHTSHKPYECLTCGKGFKVLSNLERHKILHSGILPYCCNYCGKTFSQSDNFQLHVRTYHTHEKPYLCSECGKGFVSSTRLNRHMWVHTGFKPYKCKHCPKAYANSNDLKYHERSHTSGGGRIEKPYGCTTCDMRFYHPCRLAKHMKTHEFQCSECTKSFSNERQLNKHTAAKHGPQFFEEIDLPVTVQEVFVDYQ